MNWLDQVFSSPVKVKVLRIVIRRGGLSGRSIASAAGVAPSAAKRALDALVRLGVVRRGGSPGRHRFYLSRTHWLGRDLQRLFEAEAGLAHRAAVVVERELRAARVATDVVAVGIEEAGRIQVACGPRAPIPEGFLEHLQKVLAEEVGLSFGEIHWDPSGSPEIEWVWVSRSLGPPSPPGPTFLRYFGIGPGPEGDQDD